MKNIDIFTPLEKYVLPFGFLIVFVLYLISDDKNEMQTVFYLLILLPGLILLPKHHPLITRNPYFIPLILFLAFSTLSVFWNRQADIDDFITISKNSVYIVIFFLVSGILLKREILILIFKILCLLAAYIIIESIYKKNYLEVLGTYNRLSGFGNLKNPILAATTYGAFAIFIIIGFSKGFFKTKYESLIYVLALIILSSGIILSGSRMAIGSFFVISTLIIFNHFPRYRWWFFSLFIAFLIIMPIIFPDIIKHLTLRGSSYRPGIWSQTLDQIKLSPWIGHGIYSEFEITFGKIVFSSPHNRMLATIYYTGLIGGALLLSFILAALWPESEKLSGLEVYGKYLLLFAILCSLTQGRHLITRPDILWLIIWFPSAILIMGKYYRHNFSKINFAENYSSTMISADLNKK